MSCEPLQFFVCRDVYPQHACRTCVTITAVPVAPTVIDRGIAAPDLLAQVLVAKYVDHLPLYRQEAIYARSGVALHRSTLAEWIGACGVALQPLVDRMREALMPLAVLHADETPVGMLEPGTGKTHRSYLFAYRSGIGPPIIVFDFCTSRSGQHARRFLGDYCGALMVDDYVGYNAMFAAGMAELGCWAHARRKFVDQHKASGSPIACEAIERIGDQWPCPGGQGTRQGLRFRRAPDHHQLPRLRQAQASAEEPMAPSRSTELRLRVNHTNRERAAICSAAASNVGGKR